MRPTSHEEGEKLESGWLAQSQLLQDYYRYAVAHEPRRVSALSPRGAGRHTNRPDPVGSASDFSKSA